jgi:ribosomal protein L37AE/L43A
VYIYKKRSKHGKVLAQRGKVCPSCKSTDMHLTETGKDRSTFTCQKCGAINIFTNGPNETTPQKKQDNSTKKLSVVMLRDHTSHKSTVPEQPPVPVESINETLQVVRTAMTDAAIISFDYISSDNKKSMRNVEPYKITRRNGNIILYAYDLENDGIRTFKLTNMSYVAKQPYNYKPRFDIEDKLKND